MGEDQEKKETNKNSGSPRGKKSLPFRLQLGKAGGTVWTMILMAGVYALIFPWELSLGLVVMIFIHEMGHVWAAKQKGLPVSAPAFIPFLGALITMKRQPQDAATEAYIAYGGPFVGSIGALACYGLAVYTGYEALYGIALIGFFINLFNLIPIHPLDGGRIVTAISRWFWVVGLFGGLVMILYTFNPVLMLIWTLFAFQLWRTVRGKQGKPRRLQTEVHLDPSRFEPVGMLIPSEAHQRQLPFLQYCSIKEQEHHCDVIYPGVGRIHQMKGLTGRFRWIRLVQTDQVKDREGKDYVRMRLEGEYEPGVEESMLRRDQEYYQVSPRTRFLFGFAYLGLAAFLIYMLFLMGQFSWFGV